MTLAVWVTACCAGQRFHYEIHNQICPLVGNQHKAEAIELLYQVTKCDQITTQ